jgi:tripartite-type tricarboxylate transporter receptor subunit TctC
MPVNDPGSQNGPAASGSSSSADAAHRFRVWIWLASLAIVLFSFFKVGDRAQKAAYPSRPIELIVPFGAGGGTDAFARMMKKAIDDEKLLPVPLVIRNVGGAGATIGSRQAKDSASDGYTVLLLHNALLTAKFAGMVEYGPEAFEPIAATGEVGMVIAVAKSSKKYETLGKLMDATKTKPNTVSFGANMGALTHFAGLQLEQTTKGSAFRYVASGGGAERLEDLLGGHVDVSGFSIEEFIRYRSAGLRGLAYLGVERHAGAPHILTAQEQGYDAVRDNVFMWWFPKGTDPKKVDLFAGVLEKTMQTKFVQRKMDQIECDPIFLRGAALQQRIDVTMKQMAAVKPPPETKLPNFPAIMFGAVLCMVPVVVVVSIRERRMQAGTPSETEDANITQQYGLAAAASGLTIAYAAALSFGWIGFTSATLVYVLLVGDVLTRSRAKLLTLVLGTSVALSFGVHAVFTHVFEVILP